jgi:type IV secretion system protein VirB1
MDTPTFLALALACSPQVHPATALALANVESALNPWAIGVVGAVLVRQPRTRQEAVATARSLQRHGMNFSVGLGQINVGNWARLDLTVDNAFDPCENLAAMQSVLVDCFDRAAGSKSHQPAHQAQLRRALSCYYSGNFTTGFRHGYVRKVVAATPAGQRPLLPPPN